MGSACDTPLDFRSNLHRGATASVKTLTKYEQEIVKKACHVLNLNVAGVDLLKTRSGPVVLEVNASPGLEGIETVTGVEVAKKIVQFLEGAKRTAVHDHS